MLNLEGNPEIRGKTKAQTSEHIWKKEGNPRQLWSQEKQPSAYDRNVIIKLDLDEEFKKCTKNRT